MKQLILLFIIGLTINVYSQPTQRMSIRANLFVTGEDGATPGDNLFDGIMTEYFTTLCNCIDNDDALKLGGGWATTLATYRNSKYLSVERRDTIISGDTTFLLINNHRNINMMLELSVTNVYPSNLSVTLYDSQLSTSVNIPINGSKYKYYFTGTPNAGSFTDNRFKIVLVNPAGFAVTPPPAEEFKVFPNPVYRNSELNIITESKQAYLIGINGSKISLPITNKKAKIPNTISGMYILNDGNKKTKIIIL